MPLSPRFPVFTPVCFNTDLDDKQPTELTRDSPHAGTADEDASYDPRTRSNYQRAHRPCHLQHEQDDIDVGRKVKVAFVLEG